MKEPLIKSFCFILSLVFVFYLVTSIAKYSLKFQYTYFPHYFLTIDTAKEQIEIAKLLAQADIERAKGLAEAVQIIGDSLRDQHDIIAMDMFLASKENSEQEI